ncbi:conserved hypothetical protein [Talaromyces stipitatus ATCC 10500]|uniref:Uncharacterized protein n=1 Tax=Talaromyces stipitatus (strain ATCC 10500 / CBS 375.48 / QM 6759 / NRRL 1006) TaxID=441959 RepID=B8LZA7_TALSN|nr:uncharacterized protein TSTA_088960 [Talaromyces stipitatus ATCC 10500]EED21660.1 conserved hypothetical protein [Talaromyces stipitatus ATCC 10500]
MVNWQASDAGFRFLAAVFADPSIRPDANQVAKLFGRGATSRAVDHQFSKIRRASKELVAEAQKNGVEISATPRAARTPRTPRSGGVFRSGASTKAHSKDKGLDTPTKSRKGTLSAGGLSMMDAITVDTDKDDESVISVAKFDTMSIQSDTKEESEHDTVEPKREADLTTPSIQLFGQRPTTPRVDSRSNGYVLGTGKKSTVTANVASEFSMDDIFGNYE